MAAPRVVAIVQARMGSSRLPGKVLLRAAGQSLLAHVVERLRRCRSLDAIVVATTREPADDAVVAACQALGIATYRGSTHDVLQRFAEAATAARAAIVVRLTADCPLLAPGEVDRVVAALLESGADYAANQLPGKQKLPLGFAVEAMRTQALLAADRAATEPWQREHVTPFLYGDAAPVAALWVEPLVFAPHYRVTVDTPADFQVAQAVLAGLAGSDGAWTVEGVVAWLDAHPAIAGLNAEVQQKSHLEAAGAVLLLRADASVQGGIGHVMRLLGIGEAWCRQGGCAHLLSAALPPALAKRFDELRISCAPLPASAAPGSAADAEHVRAVAQATGARLVLVDGYHFSGSWLTTLRSETLCVAYVDDYGDPSLAVDVVLMPNAGTEPPLGHMSAVLAGHRFTPVRNGFGGLPPRDYHRSRPLRILLTFGGSDPAGMTVRAISAFLTLQQADPALRCVVVVGPAHPAAAAVASLAEAVPAITLVSNVADMPALLATVDVGVTAAGTTCWELCAAGVPMLVVPVAANQAVVVCGIVGAGAGRALPFADAFTDAELRTALAALLHATPAELQAMSAAGQRLIDGQGATRIAVALARVAAGVHP